MPGRDAISVMNEYAELAMTASVKQKPEELREIRDEAQHQLEMSPSPTSSIFFRIAEDALRLLHTKH